MRLDLLQQTNHPCKGIFLELPQVGKRRLGFLSLVSVTSTTTTTTIQISQRVVQNISQSIHPTIAMPIPQNGLQSHLIIVSQRHKLMNRNDSAMNFRNYRVSKETHNFSEFSTETMETCKASFNFRK
ncbi:hypothetical protein ACJIZ3_013948 [Penstemon smallii]|uniref:Uncharacterized protein n=1 Tax=Penstemon smallii TaxID=265156 RepID=A0ABD3RIC4_9LAMI